MKKFLFGCLALFIVLAVAGGIAGYHFVYRPAREYLASFAQFQEIPRLNRQVRNQTPFAAPANHELTPEAVTRFTAAQQALHAHIGARLSALDAKYRAIDAKVKNGEASIGDFMTALKDFGAIVVEAKTAQVEALNQQNFSLAEYEWTRDRIYEAAGIPMSFSLQDAIREAAAGEKPDVETNVEAEQAPAAVPERNRELVAPLRQQLTERAGLVFFGL